MRFHTNKTGAVLRMVLDFLVQLSLVIAIAWFVVYSFGSKVINSGQSMQPLIGVEEGALMNRVIYVFRAPERYDIIAFKSSDGRINIKRIIGLPNETIRIAGGVVLIDGKTLDSEEELHIATLEGIAASDIELGEDEYFVLGDNRDSSEDSRFKSIGNVKREDIVGKLWLRISPFSRIGFLE